MGLCWAITIVCAFWRGSAGRIWIRKIRRLRQLPHWAGGIKWCAITPNADIGNSTEASYHCGVNRNGMSANSMLEGVQQKKVPFWLVYCGWYWWWWCGVFVCAARCARKIWSENCFAHHRTPKVAHRRPTKYKESENRSRIMTWRRPPAGSLIGLHAFGECCAKVVHSMAADGERKQRKRRYIVAKKWKI